MIEEISSIKESQQGATQQVLAHHRLSITPDSPLSQNNILHQLKGPASIAELMFYWEQIEEQWFGWTRSA